MMYSFTLPKYRFKLLGYTFFSLFTYCPLDIRFQVILREVFNKITVAVIFYA